MPDVRREQEHVTLLQFHALEPALGGDQQLRIASQLIEEFFQGVVMKVGALIGTSDQRDDQVGVTPDLLVSDRRT